jgi:hypothetical protein
MARTTSEPSHAGKFRSVDRYLPNGTVDATNGGWWLIQKVGGQVSWPSFLTAAETATTITAAIQAASDFISANDGGVVFFRGGESEINATLNATDKTTWKGIPGSTTIKLADSANVQMVAGHATNDTVQDFNIHGIEWDCNSANNSAAVSAIGISGVERCSITWCRFIAPRGYGIGLQATPGQSAPNTGNQHDIVIAHNYFENCGAGDGGDTFDSLDIKDGDRMFIMYNHSVGPYDNAYDVRGNEIHMFANYSTGVRSGFGYNCRGNSFAEATVQGQVNLTDNISDADANGIAMSDGAPLATNNVMFQSSGNKILECLGIGWLIAEQTTGKVSVQSVNDRIVNPVGRGLDITALATREAKFTNLTIDNGQTDGVRTATLRAKFISPTIINNAGAGIREILNVKTVVIDGTVNNNSGGNIVEGGTGFYSRGTFGHRQVANITTANVDMTTDTVQTLTTAHGLDVTPEMHDCSEPVLLEDTAVDDFSVDWKKITAVDSVNVQCKIKLRTGSATGGAVAQLGIKINAREHVA